MHSIAAGKQRRACLSPQQRLPLAAAPDLGQQRQQTVREGRHAVGQPLDQDAEQVEGLRGSTCQ